MHWTYLLTLSLICIIIQFVNLCASDADRIYQAILFGSFIFGKVSKFKIISEII